MMSELLGTVLVVDRDPQVRLLFRTALESVGYQVVTAESGQHGVNLLAHYDAEVILLDLALAQREDVAESGHLVGRLRHARPNSRIILMVERGGSVRRDEPVLEKPCRLDALLEVVGEHMRMSQAQ